MRMQAQAVDSYGKVLHTTYIYLHTVDHKAHERFARGVLRAFVKNQRFDVRLTRTRPVAVAAEGAR